MSDTSGATHKLLLATSLVLINSLFAGETLTYDPAGSGGGVDPWYCSKGYFNYWSYIF
ncbi:hypothetical protein [Campylobacter fetus]|uniref:hypothetical protein n=1 Tax=Campylobacter fetus TaxID=196 RepID=UPI001300F2A9|nr:hypothetical protein [Campylobacter fetus]